ncbi:MAG: YciI-like protein [Thermoanaerobaculia bacterium]
MHYLLLYELAHDYLERRGEFRGQHLALAWKAHEKGDLVMAGALAEPTDGAVLMFQGSSSDAAEEFARKDPYVGNGLVKSWRVRPWVTVVGAQAATPVRPDP